jgi:tetratricopeptide (TPR) repeat protein
MLYESPKYSKLAINRYNLLIRLILGLTAILLFIALPSCKESPISEPTLVPTPNTTTESPTKPANQSTGTDIISSPYGPMSLYQGQRIPLSVRYPAEWVEGSLHTADTPSYPLTLRHSAKFGSQLTITEPSFVELGLPEMSLDEYTKEVISTQIIIAPDFTLITEDYIDLENGAKAKFIVFSADSAQRMFCRLIYVHDNGIIFNFTYSYRPSVENIVSLISYSFNTLHIGVITTEPVTEPTSTLKTASEYLQRGIDLLEKGDYQAAIRDLTEAIELDPNSAEAYFFRGLAFDDTGDYDKAISDYTKSIDLDPNEGNPYYNRASLYADNMEFDKAIADYTRAIELKSAYSPESYFNRALVYALNNRFDEAIADLTSAINLRPDYIKAYDQRGLFYARTGQFNKAMEDHDKAIELDPAWAHLYFNRGVTNAQMGNIPLAIEDFNKVIEISEDPLLTANAKSMLKMISP